MHEAIAFLTAFLIGSFPSAYVWVRMKTGNDIRKMGSGNVGATNVFRSVGRGDGIAVLALDALKGIAAVWIGSRIYFTATVAVQTSGLDPQLTGLDPQFVGFALGCTAILGHVFTPWLGFKGGKGVATGAGVALAVYPAPFLMGFVLWAAVLKISRFMSLASILAAYGFAAATFWLVPNKLHALIALLAALFITWTHRANIARLRQGTEPRLFHK